MHSTLPLTHTHCYSHKIFRNTLFAIATCLLLVSAPHLMAQSTFGTILGTVHDSSGAVIPGATVTLTNAGTSAQRVETSDGSGNFIFSNIDIGVYKLTITAQGFEAFSQTDIGITARESRHIDAAMQLGASNQTVTVVAQQENVITTEVSILRRPRLPMNW